MDDRKQLAKHLGARIFQLRKEKGWNVSECAAAANIAVSHLSQIENGTRLPSIGTLIDLTDQLGVFVCDAFVHKEYGFDEKMYDELRRSNRRERFPF